MRMEGLDRCEGSGDQAEDDIRLDLRGLKCPLPVLRTRKALRLHPAGVWLTVLADDPMARLDIGHLCRTDGHEADPPVPLPEGGWRFRIRKGSEAEAQ